MTKAKTKTEFYSLPAHRLAAGMSTPDGQDITDVWYDRKRMLVGYDTYTPRPDNPDQDEANQDATDDRVAPWNELIELAVFADTRADGRPRRCPLSPECSSLWCREHDAAVKIRYEVLLGRNYSGEYEPGDKVVNVLANSEQDAAYQAGIEVASTTRRGVGVIQAWYVKSIRTETGELA